MIVIILEGNPDGFIVFYYPSVKSVFQMWNVRLNVTWFNHLVYKIRYIA